MAPSRKNSVGGSPPPEVVPDQLISRSPREGLRPRGESKHRRIFDHLLADIESGQLKSGDRLPSEAELGKFFDASRITVAKAVLELQRRGLVTRRPGAGTHVRGPEKPVGRTLGLVVPELGQTDVLDRICQGLVRSPHARSHSFVWSSARGDDDEVGKEAEQLVDSLIQQEVAGVFFVPLELAADKDTVNRRILRSLERSQISVVLLDHDVSAYPQRAPYDLVAMDHRRAGFIAGAHLIKLGARRPVFFAEEQAGTRAEERSAGFYEALHRSGLPAGERALWQGRAEDQALIRQIHDEARPDGIVCADDLTAAHLMHALLNLGVRIPDEVRLAGIDDMKYASLLPIPLTTVQQDFSGLGVAAIVTMLERIAHPALPARQVLLPAKLVVRRSCGAKTDHAL